MNEFERKVLLCLVIHVIGAIITIVIHYKNGTLKWCSENGDGVRYATPADVIFFDLNGWEGEVLEFLFDTIDSSINIFFREHFGKVKSYES